MQDDLAGLNFDLTVLLKREFFQHLPAGERLAVEEFRTLAEVFGSSAMAREASTESGNTESWKK